MKKKGRRGAEGTPMTSGVPLGTPKTHTDSKSVGKFVAGAEGVGHKFY